MCVGACVCDRRNEREGVLFRLHKLRLFVTRCRVIRVNPTAARFNSQNSGSSTLRGPIRRHDDGRTGGRGRSSGDRVLDGNPAATPWAPLLPALLAFPALAGLALGSTTSAAGGAGLAAGLRAGARPTRTLGWPWTSPGLTAGTAPLARVHLFLYSDIQHTRHTMQHSVDTNTTAAPPRTRHGSEKLTNRTAAL